METQLKIGGMTCQMCVGHVTRALQNVDGVTAAQVDLNAARAVVQHDAATPAEFLIEAVIDDGYEAQLESPRDAN